jgi:hypothetical protein
MNNGKEFSKEELQAELELIARRNAAVGERIVALRERVNAAEQDAKSLEAQLGTHSKVINREREVLLRDLHALSDLKGKFASPQTLDLSAEVEEAIRQASEGLDHAEASLKKGQDTLPHVGESLHSIRSALDQGAHEQSALSEKITTTTQNPTKLLVIQLYLLLLSLENDINELRKTLLEIIQDVQTLLIQILGLKLLAGQLKDLVLQVQAILTKLLIFLIPKGDKGEKGDKGDKGDPGPRGARGPRGPRGPVPPGSAPFIDLSGPSLLGPAQGAILSYTSAGLNHVNLEFSVDNQNFRDLGDGGALSLTLGLAVIVPNARNLPAPDGAILWTPAGLSGRVFVRALGQDATDNTIATDTISFVVLVP